MRPNTQAANCCESNSSSSSLARHAMLCASGSPCLSAHRTAEECVCRTTHGSVQELGPVIAVPTWPPSSAVFSPDRKRIKRSLPASVRRHRNIEHAICARRRSDRSIVHAYRCRRGGECTAAGRRAPEDLFGQAPVRLERAHHEPEPGGPVGRRRWLAADRVRRIRVRGVPRHSLDNGPPPGHHGAARLRGGRPAPGLRRHGGELVAPGRGGRSASPGFNGPTPAGRPAARPGGVGGRGRAPALRRGARSPACGRGAGRVARRATGCRYGRGSG